jgi:hypothetical protein
MAPRWRKPYSVSPAIIHPLGKGKTFTWPVFSPLRRPARPVCGAAAIFAARPFRSDRYRLASSPAQSRRAARRLRHPRPSPSAHGSARPCPTSRRTGRQSDAFEIEGDLPVSALSPGRWRRSCVGKPLEPLSEDFRIGGGGQHFRFELDRARPYLRRCGLQARRPSRALPRRNPRSPPDSRCRRDALFLTAAADQRFRHHQIGRATTSAPTPLGPPILCADRIRKSAPTSAIEKGMRPAACTASTTSNPPDFLTMCGDLADRLDDAGLVVGQHARRPAADHPARSCAASRR